MKTRVLIRFAGESDDAWHYLKLGPLDQLDPPVREFRGGDEIIVLIDDTQDKPDCVDITFDDGAFAIEVPKEFFVVMREIDGR